MEIVPGPALPCRWVRLLVAVQSPPPPGPGVCFLLDSRAPSVWLHRRL